MGRLLKGQGRLVPAAVLSAKDQAARILADAERTRAQAAALMKEAEARGYADGVARGREAGLAEALTLMAAARAQNEETLARTKDAAVTLARRMAEKIVGRAVDLSPEVMADIVAQALAAGRARTGAIVLRVHPDEAAAVEQTRPRWSPPGAAELSIRIVADATVARYGCVVETPSGRLDARLEVQLDAFQRALTGARAEKP